MSACVNAGITVLQIRSWQRVLPLVKQARDYGPVMVFVEDIDLMPSRSLTNLLDDATLKTCPISLVVTTNFPEKLDPALTRKGRLDICIGFTLPDSGTRAKILAINNVPFFDDAIDTATAGMSGADLAELSKRARITALAADRDLTASDVVGAATTMVKPPEYVQPDTLLQQLQAVMQAALGDTHYFIERTNDRVSDIHDAVC
jgi:SpoVK/Ycf46/Vps4 family AAA+-type ATPase